MVPSIAVADAVQTFSVEEYIQRGQFLLGAPVAVEGRVAVFNQTELRFRECPVRFRSTIGVLRIPDRTRTVEVTGHSERETVQGKERVVFQIDGIREIPDDQETFRARQSKIPHNASPDDWYALADWAAKRGRFYNDRELEARAEEAYLRGVKLERRKLSAGGPQGLLELAGRLSERKFPEEVTQSLVHEYCVRKVEAARKSQPPERGAQLAAAAREIEKRLRDSTRTLPVFSRQLDAAYRKSPLDAYEEADSETRRQLHRYLYLHVQEDLLTPQLADDKSNGFEIAQQIDELIPERHAWAEELRDQALAFRASEVGKLGRAEMLALVKEYRDRKETAAADRLVESWLVLRRRKLPADDLEGLLELSEEYRKLLKQDATADRMLLEAWKHHPQSPELAAKLTERGYRLHENTWMTETDFNSRPEAEHERALREGRILAGMTATQVRQARGRPDSVARSVSRGQVNELWTYRLADSSRMIVHLTRFTFRSGEPKVVSWRSVKE